MAPSLAGDLLGHEFTIERDGQTVATVSKRWLSLTASYAVDVTPAENSLLILASVRLPRPRACARGWPASRSRQGSPLAGPATSRRSMISNGQVASRAVSSC
jgi:hypothetical protein